ncbi:MAG: amidohydrolase family protein [Planctomycetia bacterium]|nr:amidohydrolase family protein [Planctomycetia bacterium]
MNPPEYNITGLDYAQRSHFRYAGPLIDVHSHITTTELNESTSGFPGGAGRAGSLAQAETQLAVARTFGIARTYTMCPPQDIPPLRERFGSLLGFNGPVHKEPDEPNDVAYRVLDQFLEQGVEIIKFWGPPRMSAAGQPVDAPWRLEVVRRARMAGVKVFMLHVSDPDAWFETAYTDILRYGTKQEHYYGLHLLLRMFPDVHWIGAHLAGDPEHPEHLEELLELYPNLYFDTSATKWQVREVSRQRDAIRRLVCKHPTRFLFGVDLLTRHTQVREHYISRYWCQRTLWESDWDGHSPIADGDYRPKPGEPPQVQLRGLGLPEEVLWQVYHDNVLRLFTRRRP